MGKWTKQSDGSYYVITESWKTTGDCLSKFCTEFKQKTGITYNSQQIAKYNNIPDHNKIYVGQIIYFPLSLNSSSSSGSSSKSIPPNTVIVDGPGLLNTSDDELIASWSWSSGSTKDDETVKYKTVWEYQLNGANTWYSGQTADKTVDKDYTLPSTYDTYKIPTHATTVRFKVKPVAEDKETDDLTSKKEPKWTTPSWTSFKNYTVKTIFENVSAPKVEIDENNKLTAYLSDLDINATHIKFQVIKDDKETFGEVKSQQINSYNYVSFECNVDAGHDYKVRCKAVKGNMESDWSPFSDNVPSMPSAPSGISKCSLAGENNEGYYVYLEWGFVKSAKTYEIEYATEEGYFDNPTGHTTTKSTSDNSTNFTVYGIGEGGKYFFRVRAARDTVKSDWTKPVSVVIGEPPDAPTTWSSTTTAIVGQPLNLYWMHNPADGSSQTKAVVEIETIQNGVTLSVDSYTLLYTDDNKDDDFNGVYSVDTSVYSEGVKLKWRVQTAGVTGIAEKWSIDREVDIYAQPSLGLTVTDTFNVLEDGTIELLPPEGGAMDVLEAFPFYAKAVAAPPTQSPVGYHMTISSNEIYETVDQLGNSKTVSIGDQVYSKYFDVNTPLLVEFSANNVDLENNIEYTIKCVASMDSGLTAEASLPFRVAWADMLYVPDAEVSINYDTYSASIRPYCEDHKSIYCKVAVSSGIYSVTTETLDENEIVSAYTTTGEEVFIGKNIYNNTLYYCIKYLDQNENPIDPTWYRVNVSDGTYVASSIKLDGSGISKVRTSSGEEVFVGIIDGVETLYCAVIESSLVEDVTLSIYRREFDGSFTEIATNISNATNTFVVDPHPALNYARYRIVAKTISTGAISYCDLANIPIGGKSIIIQWDEAWTTFNNWSEDPMVQPPWSGSLLKLNYNIDVSDSNSPDVTHVKYIGRKRPVAYYGTQLGETSSWSVTIEKDDEETIYALRRLAAWMGDVYVREPSGTGYWANVKVNFGIKHKDLTIPVTLDITRVEGGI